MKCQQNPFRGENNMNKLQQSILFSFLLVLVLLTSAPSGQTVSSDEENARQFIARTDSKLHSAEKPSEKQRILIRLAPAALVAGDSEAARKYSQELIRIAESDTSKVKDDSLPVHIANTVLGLIAIKEGKIDEAKVHLFASTKFNVHPKLIASPVLVSFGPNMDLARALLERNERDAVLKYFDLCSKFWKDPNGKLPIWREVVGNGGVPDFKFSGSSLQYWRQAK